MAGTGNKWGNYGTFHKAEPPAKPTAYAVGTAQEQATKLLDRIAARINAVSSTLSSKHGSTPCN